MEYTGAPPPADREPLGAGELVERELRRGGASAGPFRAARSNARQNRYVSETNSWVGAGHVLIREQARGAGRWVVPGGPAGRGSSCGSRTSGCARASGRCGRPSRRAGAGACPHGLPFDALLQLSWVARLRPGVVRAVVALVVRRGGEVMLTRPVYRPII